MRVERTDIKGKKITRDEIHKIISKNSVYNEIINNTIFAFNEWKDERKKINSTLYPSIYRRTGRRRLFDRSTKGYVRRFLQIKTNYKL